MLTDSLVTLVTECFRNNNVSTPRASAPPLGPGLGLLRAGDCRRVTEDCLALLTQDGTAWHCLPYLAAALLLFFIYRVAFLPVDRVKVSASQCLCVPVCLLSCNCRLARRAPPAALADSFHSSSTNTPASHCVTWTPSATRGR